MPILRTLIRPVAIRILAFNERRKSGVVWNP